MNKEWKDKVKLISEMNDVSLSHFIRTSIERTYKHSQDKHHQSIHHLETF